MEPNNDSGFLEELEIWLNLAKDEPELMENNEPDGVVENENAARKMLDIVMLQEEIPKAFAKRYVQLDICESFMHKLLADQLETSFESTKIGYALHELELIVEKVCMANLAACDALKQALESELETVKLGE
ncbi:uncharacterized protein LOC131262362 [Anopheles coustani]|uniref:uncharacterized protein LOC131262362 n=1 Tax=Anopheles coustani TaxID=139045 RepID=UPI00265A6996|nr:uncharacterized protein LOC131262362 [Anopheles coustani]